MKLKFNKKYNIISLYSLVVIMISIIFYRVIMNFNLFSHKVEDVIGIFKPFIIGFVIAYLLNFILQFYEVKILSIKIKNKKASRLIGILLSYVTVGLIFYLFFQFIMPQLIDSVVLFLDNVPKYIDNITQNISDTLRELGINDNSINDINTQLSQYTTVINEKILEGVNKALKFVTGDFIPMIVDTILLIASSIWNLVLGIIISIYLLIEKENLFSVIRKIIYSIFSKHKANKILEISARSREIFDSFVGGKILNCFIIGVFSFIVLAIFKMPYSLLIAVIIGISNMVPFFGPFIGAIPSAIMILLVSPIQALWFLVIVVFIQQIDSNIIGPKILGESVGISAFWILFAVLVGEEIFGFVGVLIGVPLFAIIYSIVKEVVENSLSKKGLPVKTNDYTDLKR